MDKRETEWKKYVADDIDKIVSDWNDKGIVIEGEIHCISRTVIRKHMDEIYKMIVENGGISVADEEIAMPLTGTAFVDNEGYFVYFYNPDIFDVKEAEEYVRKVKEK